jgi:putative membrane protein
VFDAAITGDPTPRFQFRRERNIPGDELLVGEPTAIALAPGETSARSRANRAEVSMNRSIVTLVIFALASPAAAQSMSEKMGVNSALGIAPKTDDFVKEAAISDMFEIQSSQLAQSKGDDQTKAFAAQMITAHQKTTEELKGLIDSGKVKEAPPTQMDSAHQKMLDKLQKLNGADFDKQYDSDQVSGLKQALSLFERYSKRGGNADLKDWAAKTLPTIQHHLDMARGLKG